MKKIGSCGVFKNDRAKLLGTEKLFTIFPGNWHSVMDLKVVIDVKASDGLHGS